jgi:hypothetical protein
LTNKQATVIGKMLMTETPGKQVLYIHILRGKPPVYVEPLLACGLRLVATTVLVALRAALRLFS